jgi:hypothetical protein
VGALDSGLAGTGRALTWPVRYQRGERPTGAARGGLRDRSLWSVSVDDGAAPELARSVLAVLGAAPDAAPLADVRLLPVGELALVADTPPASVALEAQTMARATALPPWPGAEWDPRVVLAAREGPCDALVGRVVVLRLARIRAGAVPAAAVATVDWIPAALGAPSPVDLAVTHTVGAHAASVAAWVPVGHLNDAGVSGALLAATHGASWGLAAAGRVAGAWRWLGWPTGVPRPSDP